MAVGIPVGAESNMAEYGEWNRKGATLSSVTAQKEYGVEIDFIEEGIRAGELEYRQGAVWGNPYLRVMRNQLERYISAQLGECQESCRPAFVTRVALSTSGFWHVRQA